jgi:hypothetical protein
MYSLASAEWKADTHPADRINELEARVKELEGALERIVSTVPANDGTGCFVFDHHSPDGEYLGTQNIDPLWVVEEMASVAMAALKKEKP